MAFNRPSGGDNSDIHIGINVTTNKQQLAASKRDIEAFNKTLKESFGPDNATSQRANKGFADQRRSIELNRREAERVTSVYQSWGKVLGEIDRANYIDGLTADLNKAIKSGKDLDVVMEGVKVRLQEIGATEGEVRRVIGAAQAAGGGGAGAALKTFGREARIVAPAIRVPGTNVSSEGAFRLVEVAGRVQEAFGQLSPTMQTTVKGAGALALGIAALAVGFNALNEQFAKQTRAIIGGQEEATHLRLQGSKEEIQAAIDQKVADEEVTRARIEENKRLLASVEQGVGPVGAALADVLNIAGIQELRKETQNLEQQLETNAVTTGRLTGLLDDEEVQARLTAEAIEELRKQRQQEVDNLARTEVQLRTTLSSISGGTAEAARSRLASITAERTALSEVVQQSGLSAEATKEFYTELNRLGQEFQIVQTLLPDLEVIERAKAAQKDQEDAQKQLIDLTSKAVDIETRGQERINNIREQGLKQIETAEERLADARQKLVDFNTEALAKASEVNIKFMTDDLERIAKFRVNEQKINRDADKEALRALQDHNDSLLDAEQANDVAAFIAEQRRFKKESDRRKEDRDTATQDRLDDLEAEREKSRQVRDERLADLQTETDKKRADLQAEIVDRESALATIKRQIEDRVKAERAAIDQSLRDLVTSFDSSAQHMQETVAQGFAVMAQAGINATNAIVDNLIQRANSPAFQFSGSGVPPIIPTGSGSSGTAFAGGGIVTRPTFAKLGERSGYHEAVIPYRQSEGIAAALARLGVSGGSAGDTYNMAGMFSGATIGGDVSQADLQALEQAVYMGLTSLRTGQAPGAA